MKIKEIGKTITGKTPLTSHAEYYNGDIPFYGPADLNLGFVLNDAINHISQEGFNSIINNTLQGISILVGCIGNIGKVAITDGVCATNQQINSITNISNEINPYYLYYNLCFRQKQFQILAGNTILPILTKTDFEEIDINFPSKEEQDKIARTLKTLDRKISLNRRMNTTLEAMAKQLYDYWFVQFDFPNAKGKPYKSSGGKMVWNEKMKREIPEGWEVKELRETTENNMGSLVPSDNPDTLYKHFSIPQFDCNQSYALEKGCDILSNKFILTENDVVVSKLNPWISRVLWGQSLENAICSTEFVSLAPNDIKEKGFIYFLAKSDPFIAYCTKSSTGTSHSHRRVNPEIMSKFVYPYNKDIIVKYSELTSKIAEKIVANISQITQLTSLRDFLLPLLMNGQVTVT